LRDGCKNRTAALENAAKQHTVRASGGYGEGFLMRVAAERFALVRQRPAFENLPRRKPPLVQFDDVIMTLYLRADAAAGLRAVI